MGKSLIQTTNQTTQAVDVNGIIAPGSVLRRYGCDIRLSGNAIEVNGDGYYEIDAAVSVAPTAEGPVTVALFDNGVQIPGAIAYGNSTAADPVTLPITCTIRQRCCEGAHNLTFVLQAGAGNVQNISVRVARS